MNFSTKGYRASEKVRPLAARKSEKRALRDPGKVGALRQGHVDATNAAVLMPVFPHVFF